MARIWSILKLASLVLVLHRVHFSHAQGSSTEPTPSSSTITTVVDFHNFRIQFRTDSGWQVASDGLSRFSLTSQSSLEYTFSGTRVRVFGAKNGLGASWTVRIDGGPATVGSSFRNGSKQRNLLLFDSGVLQSSEASNHSLIMVHTGEDGKEAIDFEKFEVVSLAGTRWGFILGRTSRRLVLADHGTNANHLYDELSISCSVPSIPQGSPQATDTIITQSTETSRSNRFSASADASLSASNGPDSQVELGTVTSGAASSARKEITNSSEARSTTQTGEPTTAISVDPTSPSLTDASTLLTSNSAETSGPARSNVKWLIVVIPLALAVPALLAICTILWRQYALKRRKGLTLRWSAARGLRYSMDFECRGHTLPPDTTKSSGPHFATPNPTRHWPDSRGTSSWSSIGELSSSTSYSGSQHIGQAY